MDVEQLERLQGQRRACQIAMAAGLGLIFIGSIALQLVLVGSMLVLGGAIGWGATAWRIRRLRGDPWAYDPELDGPDAPF